MEAVVQKQTKNGYQCIPASLKHRLTPMEGVHQTYFCFDAETANAAAKLQSTATAVFPVDKDLKKGQDRDWSFSIWLGFDAEETGWLLEKPKRIGALKKWIFRNAAARASELVQQNCPLPKEELKQILAESENPDALIHETSEVATAIWAILLEAAKEKNLAFCLPATETLDDLFFDLLTQVPRPLRRTSIASPCMPTLAHATFNFFKGEIAFDRFLPGSKTTYTLDGVKRSSFYLQTAEFLAECQRDEELNIRWNDPRISNFADEDIACAVLQYPELVKADFRRQQEARKKNPVLSFLLPVRQEAVPEGMRQNDGRRTDGHFRKAKKRSRIFRPKYLWPLTQIALCLWLVMQILENATSYLEEDHTFVLNLALGSTPFQTAAMVLLIGLVAGLNVGILIGSRLASRHRIGSRFYPRGRKITLWIPDKTQPPVQSEAKYNPELQDFRLE